MGKPCRANPTAGHRVGPTEVERMGTATTIMATTIPTTTVIDPLIHRSLID
jgi:hypothetical protein